MSWELPSLVYQSSRQIFYKQLKRLGLYLFLWSLPYHPTRTRKLFVFGCLYKVFQLTILKERLTLWTCLRAKRGIDSNLIAKLYTPIDLLVIFCDTLRACVIYAYIYVHYYTLYFSISMYMFYVQSKGVNVLIIVRTWCVRAGVSAVFPTRKHGKVKPCID